MGLWWVHNDTDASDDEVTHGNDTDALMTNGANIGILMLLGTDTGHWELMSDQ